MLDYNIFIKQFDINLWDFSYLTYEEIQEVLNFPIKFSPNFIEKWLFSDMNIDSTAIFLIVVKQTKNYDYSLNSEFLSHCNNLKIEEFWCNYKYAAVRAGLGQYAKNSLFYHPKFQFDTHIGVFVCHENMLNLPQRNIPNFNILSYCINCNDCYNACPVGAIHNQQGQVWIDAYKCDNFCFYGNNPQIPSIKWNKIPIEFNITDYNFIYDIKTSQDFFKYFPNAVKASYVDTNGKRHENSYPICRECTSQLKCTKYNGNYPYDWNDIKYG